MVLKEEKKMNSREIVVRRIKALEVDLQRYTMFGKDEVQARFMAFQLEEYRIILQDLDRLEELEKLVLKTVEELANEEHRANELCDKNIELMQKNKKLKEKYNELQFDYNDLQKDYDAKDLECIDLLKENQELKDKVDELEHAISILKEKLVPILLLQEVDTLEEYNEGLDDCDEYRLIQEEFDLLKKVFESVGGSDE